MTQSESFSNSLYADQMHLAGRQLISVHRAVAQLFGTDQARISVEDWLDESGSIDASPRSTHRDWRAITIAASVRLANRLNVALTAGTQVSPIPSPNCFDSTPVS